MHSPSKTSRVHAATSETSAAAHAAATAATAATEAAPGEDGRRDRDRRGEHCRDEASENPVVHRKSSLRCGDTPRRTRMIR
jgi:hypothetical protein